MSAPQAVQEIRDLMIERAGQMKALAIGFRQLARYDDAGAYPPLELKRLLDLAEASKTTAWDILQRIEALDAEQRLRLRSFEVQSRRALIEDMEMLRPYFDRLPPELRRP